MIHCFMQKSKYKIYYECFLKIKDFSSKKLEDRNGENENGKKWNIIKQKHINMCTYIINTLYLYITIYKICL